MRIFISRAACLCAIIAVFLAALKCDAVDQTLLIDLVVAKKKGAAPVVEFF
jgi:hypothetical protein